MSNPFASSICVAERSRSSAFRQAQRGLSLIELMVAITIALFLLGGLLALVENTRQAFGAQNQLSQLQDNERLAMERITDVVQSAGYFPDPTSNTADSALLADADFPVAGQPITGTSGGAGGSDTIDVRFASSSQSGTDAQYNALDCTGASNQTGGLYTYENLFSIQNGYLVCTLNGTAYQIVSGVQSMSILYGVQTSSTASGSNVDSYLTAAQMTSTYWDSVLSVWVTLKFTNPLSNYPGQPATVSFSRVIGVQNKLGITL